jgi:anaerobic ribonucleoside-triphosphate reductase activating protein
VQLSNFDYIKLGPYLAHLGPLKSRRTNQRLYKVVGGTLHDITSRFWQHA